jgi:hypothetical protein
MHTRPFHGISSDLVKTSVGIADPISLPRNQCLRLLYDLFIGFFFGDAFGEGGCVCVDLFS